MGSERAAKDEGYRFDFSGGCLCLDFANTIAWRTGPLPEEHLTTFEDLVSWAVQGGVWTPTEGEQARARPEKERAGTLTRALRLRGAISDVFQALVRRRAIPISALETISRFTLQACDQVRLGVNAEGVHWMWIGEGSSPDRLFWEVARSASRLLITGHRERVRLCDEDRCGWFFLDTSRNRSRRWCDMRICGNRAKARRFNERRQSNRNALRL